MITLRLPEIPSEFAHRVYEDLVIEWFDHVKLAALGLLGVWLGYCLLIFFDSGIHGFEYLMAAQWALGILVLAYVFRLSRFIRSPRIKLVAGDLLIALTILCAGISFYFQLPQMRDPGLQIVGYGICIGVLGAAAFAFAPSQRSFLIFAAAWAFPLEYFLFFESGKNSLRLLGLTQLIYIAVLFCIGRLDYIRRVQLILNELRLQKSHTVITRLKNEQDGDYYLTSLLLQPLLRNKAGKSDKIRFDFLNHQYKKFEFRNHRNEIGGDFSSAHTLSLKGRDCSVFINADAMGKSIQGAGGALILGAVFESIIERTRARFEYKNMYPERWLKSAYIELNNIFENLEGTMLVSMILGVIEHESGMLYFINAEHPGAVIYRDRRASFIPTPSMFRKLGMPGADEELTISTYQLLPADIIYLGSDGRDDLWIRGSGDLRMNEDEHLFLRNVEKADGDIQALFNHIRECGEIRDDVSLVRISYTGMPLAQKNSPSIRDAGAYLRKVYSAVKERDLVGAQAILTELAETRFRDPQVLRLLVRLAFKAHAYSLAAKWSEIYLRLCDDIEIIYLASLAHKRLENYSSSADLFERMRLRGIRDPKIVSHLNDIYAKLGVTKGHESHVE